MDGRPAQSPASYVSRFRLELRRELWALRPLPGLDERLRVAARPEPEELELALRFDCLLLDSRRFEVGMMMGRLVWVREVSGRPSGRERSRLTS